jgi:prepilin-type processing-associated H-X9-DG protein
LTYADCIASKQYSVLMFGEAPMGSYLNLETASNNGLANKDLGGVDTHMEAKGTPSAGWQNNRGLCWVLIQPSYITFSAFLPPNPTVPSYWNMNKGFFAANSYHSGKGVNAAFADGSVRWAASSVDLTIWRNAASIEDGEVFSGF